MISLFKTLYRKEKVRNMKRMKKVLVFLLIVCMLMTSMFTTVFAEQATPHRPAFAGKLLEITPQRVTDTFDYLTEFYVENHPEAALIYNIADETDRNAIHRMAQLITEGCTTDKQKADAIEVWLDNYITYDVDASAYANDTFYNRIGDCMSYANLMQAMLRSLGIPAVVGDGWRGDMANVTVDLFNQAGHAWCFVFLDDQWVLYDPLWLNGGTTDREYMAKWIYFDTVENVVPASDADNLPPVLYNMPQIYYTDGNFYCFSENFPNGVGSLTRFVNNMTVIFITNQCEKENGISDGWYILTGDQNKDDMFVGEVYQDGWISYGEYEDGKYLVLTYAFPNGMQIDGAVVEFDGVKRLLEDASSYPILADEEDYSIQYGTFALKVGYSGPFLGMHWGDCEKWKDCVVTISSQNEAVATVDANGIISCHSVGFATFEILLRENGGNNALYSIDYIDVYVTDEDRVPNFEINPNIGKSGWVLDGGKWYFYEKGEKVKNDWRKDSVGWVFLGKDGAMLTNTWCTDSKGWCYVGADGYAVTNCWKKDSKGWIWLDANGSMTKSAWVKDGGKWYYLDANGYMISNQWKKDSVGWVYLGSSGAMLTNAWCTDSQGWCYVGADGYAVTNCWKKDSVGWIWLNANGSMTKSAWVKDGGEWYYLDANGYMIYNVSRYIGGKTYYFNSSGVCTNP